MPRIVALFSQWLEGSQIHAGKIAPHQIRDYLQYRKRIGYQPYWGDAPALTRMLLLLDKTWVITRTVSQPTLSPSEKLLGEYETFLKKSAV